MKRLAMTLLRLAVMIVVCTQLAAWAEEQRTSLNNADVIKMSTLGFSEQVMLAKVKQAASTEFTVEIADIEILQKEGVPQAVIAAMLERSSATTLVSTTVPAPASMVEPASPDGSRPASEVPVVTGPMGLEPASEVGTVRLMTKDKGELALTSIGGTVSTTYAYVTMLVHRNYAGIRAAVRTSDNQPFLLVRSASNPAGRYYFVKAEVDKGDDCRSVKMGNMGMFRARNLNAPDEDNQMACDIQEESQGLWKIVPKKPLKPGEYGFWVPNGDIFDFGVDKR